MTDIIVPTLGESVTEATVARWLKSVGDAVDLDEAIVELETDKVTLEVPSPVAGALSEILADEGAEVEPNAILGRIEAGAKVSKSKSALAPIAQTAKVKDENATKESVIKTSPAVRKLLAEHNIDVNHVSASGKGGRVTKADVLAAIEVAGKSNAPLPTAEKISVQQSAPASKGQEERVPMTALRKTIAKRLKSAQNEAAILTTFNEVDMTAVMNARAAYKDAFEKRHGVRLGFMGFFVMAAVSALREFPAVGASIDGGDIVYKNYHNIGVAVSTPQGLVVPVVRDAQDKSMACVEGEIASFGARAREGALSMDDMTGGTFTITNGGVFGSLLSTPILNPPQSGILGLHKIAQRPIVLENGEIAARPMMYLALSYDHRIVDGREAVRFLVHIKSIIEDPQRLLLEI